MRGRNAPGTGAAPRATFNEDPDATELGSTMLREHTIEIRVRYCETDAMGVLHHSNYLSYFEMGRTELLRASGGSYRDMEDRGRFLVVTKVGVKYLASARYDDLLTLKTTLAKISFAKLEHAYEIRRDGQLLTTGETTLACVDREGKVQRMAELFPELFQARS